MPALPRILVAVFLVAMLFAFGAGHFSVKQQLRTQEASLQLLEQENRALRQQLEAERILAAAQARLLQKLSPGGPPPAAVP